MEDIFCFLVRSVGMSILQIFPALEGLVQFYTNGQGLATHHAHYHFVLWLLSDAMLHP